MKKLSILASMAIAVALFVSCSGNKDAAEEDAEVEVSTQADTLSYALGVSAASDFLKYNVIKQQFDLDSTAYPEVIEGLVEYEKAGEGTPKAAELLGMQIGNNLSMYVEQVQMHMQMSDSTVVLKTDDVEKIFAENLTKEISDSTYFDAMRLMQDPVGKGNDSLTYALGVSAAYDVKSGLESMKVSKEQVKDFLKGFQLSAGDKDGKKKGFLAGVALGQQIIHQMLPYHDRGLFANDTTKHVSKKVFLAAFRTVLRGGKPRMSIEEAKKYQDDYVAALQEKQEKEREKEAQKLKKEGEDFLAANKTKDGVKTTESGLQYKVVREGNGKRPTAEQTVEVNYEGRLVDGTVFDSSYKRGESISFPLNGVIKGWTEGLQLMDVGSEYELYIPYDLAYGEHGTANIPPYSALIFKVELLGIE